MLHAYANLQHDRDFAVVMEDLKSRMDAARDAADTATDILHIGRSQGAALMIKDVLRLAQGGAREALDKKRQATKTEF